MRYDARSAAALALQNEIKLYQRILPGKLIGLWPLIDKSGTVVRDFSGARRNAAYVNSPTLGREGILRKAGAPLFVPASNTYINSFSTSMVNAFNGQEGTFAIWFKVRAASVWTDGAARDLFIIAVDGSNLVLIRKDSVNNQLFWQYNAGGTVKTGTAAYSATTLSHAALTWSKSGDALKFLVNGVQQGATINALGTWSGVPTNGNCGIGSQGGPSFLWDGVLAYAALWSAAMPAALVPYIARRRPHALAA